MFDMVLKEVLIRQSSPRAVCDFLFEVLVGTLPAPGEAINVTTVSWREPGVIDHLVFQRPPLDDALFDYVNFAPVLQKCEPDVIITLLASLLVERRIVFSSDRLFFLVCYCYCLIVYCFV